MPELTIGIIGGLGPQATADLFRKIIEGTPVERERDHLHILIDNQPRMPDRNNSITGEGPSAGPFLAAVARNLQSAGADFLILASNTPHVYASEIREAVSIPFVDMIDEVCDALVQQFPSVRSAGVLAAQGCLNAKLYQEALWARGITPYVPCRSELRRLMDAINAVKLKKAGSAERTLVHELVKTMIGRGAEAIILACTELPLLFEEYWFDVPVLNCNSLLADAAVGIALGKRPLTSAGLKVKEDARP